jgi:hypothetical protein
MKNILIKKYTAKVITNCIALIAIQLAIVTVAQASETFYLTYDRQGSLTSVYSDANEAVLEQRWSPWGARVDHEGRSTRSRSNQGFPMRRGYADQKHLLDADLPLVGDASLYDPKLKRFYNIR